MTNLDENIPIPRAQIWRVLQGKRVRCRYCDMAVTMRSVAGTPQAQRVHIECVGCDRINFLVDVQGDRIEPVSITPGAGERKATSEFNRRPRAHKGTGKDCRIDECNKQAVGRNLCKTHYYSWHACDKPDVEAWVAAGAPSATRWRRLGDDAPAGPESSMSDQPASAPPGDESEAEVIGVQDRAEAIRQDMLVNHLPRIREGIEKGYVDENQILVLYDHAVRCRVLMELHGGAE